jgi:hypothetical protein
MTTNDPQAQAITEECWSHDGETFDCQSLGELLDNHGDELAPGDTVYVGTAHRPPLEKLIYVDDVLEPMGERAYEIVGEHAEDYPEVSQEAKGELLALLLGWARKHAMPNFWTVRGVREYVLSEEDLAVGPSNSELPPELYAQSPLDAVDAALGAE